MHPVGYLLEDIYRNYWGIAPAAVKEKERKSLFRAGLLRRFETGRHR